MAAGESRNSSADRAALTATFCAASMIAAQVAGKATRDALFLSQFHISTLPLVLIAAAILSIGVTLLVSRLLAEYGPGRVTPPAFVLSAVLLLAEWGIASFSPRAAAIVVYLHTASLGAVLISGFWSLLNERFDPRSAKRRIARIGAGGTLGGVLGGLAAERVGTYFSVPSMLPLLALLHLVCFLLLREAGKAAGSSGEEEEPAAAEPAGDGGRGPSGLGTIRRMPYLRNLAVLVAVGTVAATCIDYVFKAKAAGAITDGGELMRFFAVFYTAISLLTFFVQSGAARRVLEKFGLARAVASLPLAVAGGSLGVLFAPGLASAAAARGLESILRSSIFRSGYELLYTPIRPADKRTAKPFIDIGADRLGDMIGGALIRLILVLPIAAAEPILIAIALFLGACGLILARRLHLGYIVALEKSLVSRAVGLSLDDVEDRTTRTTMIQTISSLGIPEGFEKSSGGGEEGEAADREREVPAGLLADLRSRDPVRVRDALSRGGKIDPAIAPEVVPLLAWDDMSGDAARALARIAPQITGFLVDRLLDEWEEFAIRRRIPGILGACPTDRSITGLIDALGDTRFEVRFRSGRSLSRIRRRDPERPVDEEKILSAVLREVQVDRRVWESRRLLDTPGDEEKSIFVDEVLRDRADRSLEHVFDLLALVLPSEPLKIAFRGLHTTDVNLRGTALEYLESVLPDEVRDALWPFLETEKWKAPEKRSRKTIVEDLLRSNQSIRMNLEELRRERGDSD